VSASIEPLFMGGAGNSPEVTRGQAGSKAALLWRLAQLGLNVPPAFVMPTSLCSAVNAGEEDTLNALANGLSKGIIWLEEAVGRRFGDPRAPLLVSVRSGAAASMPGMLETVLNVGLNDETVRGLIRLTGNPRLAFDSYRRFIQGYAEVVEGASKVVFEQQLSDVVRRENVAGETDLDPDALERLCNDFRERGLRITGHALPQDPRDQLFAAAQAVYRSWESPRAKEYRRLNRLTDLQGTAVTVQAMVFGNSGGKSGAGVAFSRNPATGAGELYVDFLFDAQGEDVVSGRRTPANAERLNARLPDAARALADGVRRIEKEFRDAQDVEFTIEDGRLYFLQTRSAKRSPRAALRIAVSMVHEGLIDKRTALSRVADIDPKKLAVTRFAEPATVAAKATSAAPGVACGRVAFSSASAKESAAAGEPVILVRPDTSTEDVAGFAVAAGILTAVGGRTSHAAVVARQLGKVCLVGCRQLTIDEDKQEAALGDSVVHEGDWLALDGDSGEVTLGRRKIVTEDPQELAEIKRWQAELMRQSA
jgi:pyruvate, orthophosphate dikinase